LIPIPLLDTLKPVPSLDSTIPKKGKDKVPLSPVIKNLRRWRKDNSLSQRQAVDVMSSRGFDVALTTLQAWEQGSVRQGHYSESALRGFLEKYPTITGAREYGRWATKAPDDRLLEMKKLRDDGATYAQIGEKFGVSEGRAWRILNGNQKRPKRDGAKTGRPKKPISSA
jgi:hypothetical protein